MLMARSQQRWRMGDVLAYRAAVSQCPNRGVRNDDARQVRIRVSRRSSGAGAARERGLGHSGGASAIGLSWPTQRAEAVDGVGHCRADERLALVRAHQQFLVAIDDRTRFE